MRWFNRFLLFWTVALPLFYVFGLPKLLDTLQTKSRAQSYEACLVHLKTEGLAGTATAVLSPAQGNEYCQCVSNSITLIKEDVWDLAQRKQPARLNEAMKPQVEDCNKALQEIINTRLQSAPTPRITREPDGTETVHF